MKKCSESDVDIYVNTMILGGGGDLCELWKTRSFVAKVAFSYQILIEVLFLLQKKPVLNQKKNNKTIATYTIAIL